VLKAGDIVKFDLGVHIDGYIAMQAHTVLVGAPAEVDGTLADVYTAAFNACEVMARKMQPGANSKDVVEACGQVADAYGCNIFVGSTIHQLKRYVIDGAKNTALSNHPDAPKADKFTFEAGEAYAIDLAMTSGEGKFRDNRNARTTVFKRNVETK
jgi:methionine aminopeptidase